MNPVIEVRNLTKRYKDKLALDDVSFDVQENTIYGLLGRNGAGKTTAMSILTAQNLPTSGQVRVFGADPYENARVLSRMCFVRESQKYPDDATARHAFTSARLFFPRWDQELADELIDEFQLPLKRTIKKLSRGQLSAVGVIIGLASRAEITFFDEPYLGLDAVARQIFYDRLLADYAEHPRTVLLSSHLIDEVANLLERVLVIDAGRIIMDESTDD
ncbi:ABC transporter ATP-binding protein, partial [Kocuria sp. CPCC 205292]